MYMRASLENFRILTLIKLIFLPLQILCRYKGHACRLTCTDKFYKCTDKTPKKHYGWGGGGPLATLVQATDKNQH